MLFLDEDQDEDTPFHFTGTQRELQSNTEVKINKIMHV